MKPIAIFFQIVGYLVGAYFFPFYFVGGMVSLFFGFLLNWVMFVGLLGFIPALMFIFNVRNAVRVRYPKPLFYFVEAFFVCFLSPSAAAFNEAILEKVGGLEVIARSVDPLSAYGEAALGVEWNFDILEGWIGSIVGLSIFYILRFLGDLTRFRKKNER